MNAIGKFLLAFNLVAGLVLMLAVVSTFRTQQNWQRAASWTPEQQKLRNYPSGWAQDLEKRKAEVAEQRAKLAQLEIQIADSRFGPRVGVTDPPSNQDLANAETQVELVQGELDAMQNNLRLFKDDVADLEAEKAMAISLLEKRSDDNSKLRLALRETRAERNELFQLFVETSSSLHKVREELTPRSLEHGRIVARLAKARVVADRHAINAYLPRDGQPPKLFGKVLRSSGDGRIEISLGSDVGIAPGHTLTVYRRGPSGGTFLGKVEVVETRPEMSVARVLKEFQQGPIERDDRVVSRLQ